MGTFVESDCTIEHEGQKFESGGAWLCHCSDGIMRGVVYAKPVKGSYSGTVTDWHGNHIANARFGPVYRGAFCNMRAVSFVLDGKRFYGRYCPDWAEAVRVRSSRS